jgi:tRNA pseudouridine13 synthase
LPGREDPDWQLLNDDFVTVIQAQRHQQKLRRGALKENRFVITLTEVQGDHQLLEQRLNSIRETGVPNYFGEQRFGRNEANLKKAADMFAGKMKVKNRQLRSLLLSSARSLIFNEVLSKRVADGSWQQALPGDVMMLDGSRSFFPVDAIDDTILQRVREFDIHSSGPLWGRGQLPVSGEIGQLEMSIAKERAGFCEGLEKAGMKQERRALRLLPRELDWQWQDDSTLQLQFGLPSGTYATSVLRECVACHEA